PGARRARPARPLPPGRAVSVDDALEVLTDQPVHAAEDGGGGGQARIRTDEHDDDAASGRRAGAVEGDGHDLRIEGAQRRDAGEPESECLAGDELEGLDGGESGGPELDLAAGLAGDLGAGGAPLPLEGDADADDGLAFRDAVDGLE